MLLMLFYAAWNTAELMWWELLQKLFVNLLDVSTDVTSTPNS